MPVYEYRCADCQSQFEVLTSYAAGERIICAQCGGGRVKKLLSVFAAPRAASSDALGSMDAFAHDDSSSMCCGDGTCGCDD